MVTHIFKRISEKVESGVQEANKFPFCSTKITRSLNDWCLQLSMFKNFPGFQSRIVKMKMIVYIITVTVL